MDEEFHLERIRSSPEDIEVLRDYARWLAANNDPRGEYIESELEFRQTLERLHDLRQKMYDLTVVKGLDLGWLDVVHPLSVTAIVSGIFYAGPSPGAPPFVKIGDSCDADTVVGILEICSVPNQIAAGTTAYVSEILFTDGQAVTGGDTLIKLARLPPRTCTDGEVS